MDLLQSLGTIFINKLLIEFEFLNNEKKTKKIKKEKKNIKKNKTPQVSTKKSKN